MLRRLIYTALFAGMLLVVGCAGGGNGNEKPTLTAVPNITTRRDDTTRAADPAVLCFDESALPEGFALTSELVSDNAASVEHYTGVDQQAAGVLARLYDEWGRVSSGQRTYSAEDRPLETAGLARTPLLDGRVDSVSCTVELYQDANGASQAFAGTGFHGPLRGRPDRGTFGVVASPEIGAESRQYLSVHAVVSASAVLFRTGNVLGRVDVVAPSLSSAGLTAEASRLALVLLEQIERDLTR